MANAAFTDYQGYSIDPGLPAGRMDCAFHADAPGNPIRKFYVNARNHGGRDSRTTTTETIGLASQGKIVTLDAAGAVAVTLDSTVPATFMAYVSSEGAGGATLTPSTGLIDNAANLSLFTLQGVALFFDGTNWWTERGMGAGGSTGVLLKTGNYTTSAADNGKLISFDLSANATLTLPSSPPPGTWSIEVENTQPGGLLEVNPNGLQLDQSTASVPIPSPHGMRIFSDGSNYYTERGMPDISQQPCSNEIGGMPTTSNKVHGLIASFQTSTPGPNFGFRQASGASAPISGFVETEIVVAAGSTLVVSAGIESNIDVGTGLPYACSCTMTQGATTTALTQIIRESDGSYGNSTALMFWIGDVPAGPTIIRVQIAGSNFPPIRFLPGVPSPTCTAPGPTPGYVQGDWYGLGGEYFVDVTPGCSATPDFEPMRVMIMAVEEIADAGSGVSVLGVNHGISPVLPVFTGTVPCPPLGFGWSTSSAFDSGPVGVSYNSDPGWKLRIVARNAAGFPHFDDQSLALFDGFPCCGGGSGGMTAFNQTVLNNTTPVTQRINLAFEPPLVATDDPTNNSTDISLELGGVSARTTTAETVDLDDYGFLVTFTNASPIAATLDSTVPNWFYCAVQVDGSGTVTFTPSSGTINGSATATLSGANAGGWLFFDGTNWFFVAGGSGITFPITVAQGGTGSASLTAHNVLLGEGTSAVGFAPPVSAGYLLTDNGPGHDPTFQAAPSGFTAGGDLSGSSSSQEVIGILNKAIDGSAPTDGQILQYSSATGKWEMVVDRPIFPVSAVVGMPNSGQLVCIYTAASSMIFPANFASPNSYGTLSTNPTATATYKVFKNGTQVGTISISTSGVFTFTTTGGTTFTLNAGDRLTITAPNPQDSTLADVGITLVGTRSATVPSALGQGIFIWRGTYNNATAYNLNDVVAYTVGGEVQSYICILATTGNIPTNTTYWNLMAQAGAAGGGSVSGIQQQLYTYIADTGAANAYVADIGPTPTRVAGSYICMKAANANTGASTLDDGSGSGAAPIKKNYNVALIANDILANQIYQFVFDGTNWQMLSWPGTPGGDVTAKYIVGDSTVPTDLANAKRWPGLYNSPDIPPVTANAMDDEFDGAFNAGSLWTWQNQGSATAADSNSWLGMVFPSNGNVDSIRYITQPLPGGTSAFTVKMSFQTAQAANFFYPAFLFRESSTGKLVTVLYGYIGGATLSMNVYNWTSNTAVGSNLFSSGTRTMPLIVYLTLKYDGTNIYFSWSADGVNFQQFYQEAKTAHFTTAPNQIGIGCDPENEKGIVGFDFFRRTL